ncbi:uncharacterized protein LOC116305998 [Actinia tenebrosa]|uniref:Uncharacterized protein LOC116305998 n=1 Tax=Actinia tenebrosa TaxID=6105 RepID=A0A6P8J2J2_ACTTE|nr:uncharacterized protein LOC116305998 [Actinia tenebrosa]
MCMAYDKLISEMNMLRWSLHTFSSESNCSKFKMMNIAEMPNLQQAFLNGQKYLENRSTIVLGISPGNPHYYKTETLERLFSLAESNSDKVLLFMPDKISEHNYKAVGSKNPEKSARVKANRLRNKCKEVMKQMGCEERKYSYVKWVEEVESCPAYTKAFQNIKDLCQRNDEFRCDIQESTEAALISMKNGRENASGPTDTPAIDLEEGVKYLLKELAFFDVLPKIHRNCEEFVFVYHRPWPVLEKYCCGFYDGIVKPSLGYVVF